MKQERHFHTPTTKRKEQSADKRSQRSVSTEKDSRINTSFDLNSSFCEHSLLNEHALHSVRLQPGIIRSKILDQKIDIMKRKEAKRGFLNKVLLNIMLNTQVALQKIKSLPSNSFKNGPALKIAKSLIKKTQLSVETSILRALLLSHQRENTAICNFTKTPNIVIYPSNITEIVSKEKQAILVLQKLLPLRLKQCIIKFKENRDRVDKIKRYFNKVICNYEKKRQQALLMLRIISLKQKSGKNLKEQSKKQRLISVSDMIRRKQDRKVNYGWNCIKIMNWTLKFKQQLVCKQLIMNSKFRRIACIKQWSEAVQARKTEMEKQSQRREVQTKCSQLQSDALNRMVGRNYLKLFKEIIRRMHIYRKVAVKIGSYSKINPHKALWRLLVNLKGM